MTSRIRKHRRMLLRGAIALFALGALYLSVTIATRSVAWPELVAFPSEEDSVKMQPVAFTAGRETRMTLGVAYLEGDVIDEGTIPRLTCTGVPPLTLRTAGTPIFADALIIFRAWVLVPAEVPDGYYPCVITIGPVQQGFLLGVE